MDVGAGHGEDRDEDAEAERAAGVMGHIDQAAGDAGVLARNAGHSAGGERGQAEPLAHAEHDHRQRDASEVVGVGRDPADPDQADQHRHATRHRHGAVAGSVDQPRGGGRGRERGNRRGQEAEPGLERRVPGDALKVLAHEEVKAEQSAVEQESGQV